MNSNWTRDLVRMIEARWQLVGIAGLSGDKALDEDNVLAMLLDPWVGSLALRLAEAEIESAVPERDAWYETRIILIKDATRNWRIDWRATEFALDALLAIVHAFLRFCTDTSAREHLTKAADIVDELCSIASERLKIAPSGSDIAAIRRWI